MRFTFKSNTEKFLSYKYRGYIISRYNGGWVFDGDSNIYYSLECAYNAIDKLLGGHAQKGAAPSRAKDIKIIGTK